MYWVKRQRYLTDYLENCEGEDVHSANFRTEIQAVELESVDLLKDLHVSLDLVVDLENGRCVTDSRLLQWWFLIEREGKHRALLAEVGDIALQRCNNWTCPINLLKQLFLNLIHLVTRVLLEPLTVLFTLITSDMYCLSSRICSSLFRFYLLLFL